MTITILGSGTGEPSLIRRPPGILLRRGRRSILIDSGPGTLRALLREGVTYRDIDEAWYTHLHCDHVAELAPILFAMRNLSSPRERDLLLLGPAGFTAFLEGLQNLYGGSLQPRGYALSVREVGEESLERDGMAIRTLPMEHSPSSVGYRVESGGEERCLLRRHRPLSEPRHACPRGRSPCGRLLFPRRDESRGAPDPAARRGDSREGGMNNQG